MIDPYEAIRQAPRGFWSMADRARYVAYCMWTLRHGTLIDPTPIGGELNAAKEALFFGWLRESSLALELIVKAAFAQREQCKVAPASVPNTHDVPKLWQMAGLPKLGILEEHALHAAQQVLQWSGRYAAPRKGSSDLFDSMHERSPRKQIVDAHASRPTIPGWERFDAIYQIAQSGYFASCDEVEKKKSS